MTRRRWLGSNIPEVPADLLSKTTSAFTSQLFLESQADKFFFWQPTLHEQLSEAGRRAPGSLVKKYRWEHQIFPIIFLFFLEPQATKPQSHLASVVHLLPSTQPVRGLGLESSDQSLENRPSRGCSTRRTRRENLAILSGLEAKSQTFTA